MPFNAKTTISQIEVSMNSMLLLHSSCQALIEAEIAEVQSPWYETLDLELGEAENLVVGWRQSGVLYFNSDILEETVSCGQTFLESQTAINALFKELEENFSDSKKATLIAKLQALEMPITEMINNIDSYLAKLKTFEINMQKPHQEMETTIAEVQADEVNIQSEITSINSQIEQLNTQITADRKAIAKAKKKRTDGIIETIFGVLFAPVTGGASLILAGIGAASIADAEGQISGMQSQISSYQKTISADQTTLSNDEAEIATLQVLTMSTKLVLTDIASIETALDSLRVSWNVLNGELSGEIEKLNNATTADEVVIIQAWYNAACNEWQIIESSVKTLCNPQISTNHVQVG